MAVQTVVKTIGTASRQYSTLQAWEDGAPVDLTTAAKYTCATFSGAFTQGETVTGGTSGFSGKMIDSDGSSYMIISDATGAFTNSETLTGTSGKTCTITTPATDTGVIWQGQTYNDSEFVSTGTALTVSGSTSSSTCYKDLTTGAGQSFRDNSTAYTNALRYNQANGVGITQSGTPYNRAINITENYFHISKVQIFGQPKNLNYPPCDCNATGITQDGCIVETNAGFACSVNGSSTSVSNTLFVDQFGGSPSSSFGGGSLITFYNCTFVCTGVPYTKLISRLSIYVSIAYENCAFFGCSASAVTDNIGSLTGLTFTTCYTDMLSPPTGFTYCLFGNAGFVSNVTATRDFRLIAGSPLINVGTTDTTNAPVDIIGRTRTVGQFDIGCIEYQPYTTTVKTIGSSGDYSTLQAWEDAAPANLVFQNTVWQGQCQNQTFSSSSPLLTVSGSTSSTTCYKHLTTVAGASFRDNANVQTNALRYNTANGAAISCTYSFGATVTFDENYAVCSNLQVESTQNVALDASLNGRATTLLNCIFEATSAGGATATLKLFNSIQLAINCLAVARATTTVGVVAVGNGASLYNCTLVSTTGSPVTFALSGNYAGGTIQNCAMFNVSAVKTGLAATYTNCYTDAASPPAGCTQVAYDTTTGSGFQNITDATRDFRIKATSALVDTGVTDAINASVDIAGTPRPYAKAYDVGCWEYTAGYVLPYAPDSLPSTWRASPGPSYWNMLADAAASDADYVQSPPLDGTQGPLIMALRTPMAAGTWTWSTRALMGGTGRQVRVTMLDASGTSVGNSGWQTLTGSFATYSLSITSSATAYSVMLEAQ